jgi:hypothetical protein
MAVNGTSNEELVSTAQGVPSVGASRRTSRQSAALPDLLMD